MAGLYRCIRDDILGIWSSAWSHAGVPIYWRSNDLPPLPDPGDVPAFLRMEVDFGRETVVAFGGGLAGNLKAQFGSVVIHVFAARATASEDDALDTMHDAMAAFRSKRIIGSYGAGAELSFIGEGSGFDQGPSEDGNWFLRGALMVFQYRYRG